MKYVIRIGLVVLALFAASMAKVFTTQMLQPKPNYDEIFTGHYHKTGPMKIGDETVPSEMEMTNGRGSMTMHFADGTTTVIQIEAYKKADGKVWLRYTAPNGINWEADVESLYKYEQSKKANQ